MSTEFVRDTIAFGTSLITALFGPGGGLLLIAAMPGFIAAAAIIPVHPVVQLDSNSSRTLFGYRTVHRQLALSFIGGSVLGVGLAAPVISVNRP